MTSALKAKVYQDGEFIEEVVLCEDVIKIGKLRSSHLHLDGDGVGRMHAVLEQQGDGGFKLIDLGSREGSLLNGEPAGRKPTLLPPTGTLKFGSFQVGYEILDASTVEPAAKGRSVGASDPNHHLSLFKSLLKELEKTDTEAAAAAAKAEPLWPSRSDHRKREWLRLMITSIREARETTKLFQRKRVATMMNLGPEGIEEIFKLSPDEALRGAQQALMDMASSKAALEMLDSMSLLKEMKEALTKVPEPQKGHAEQEVALVSSAHEKLVDLLQTNIVAGTSLLPLYLSRAGGREATEEERAQWRAAFNMMKKTSEAN